MSFFKSLIGFIKYLKLRKLNKGKKSIYIYSESKNYRNHFEDIISILSKKNKYNLIYFTSDVGDRDNFDFKVKPIFIGEGVIRILLFTILSGDMIIMTLSDLGNHELKKSNNCKHYAYLFHSLCSTFKSYTKNAFNNYDLIFANGSHQVKEIRESERLYKLDKKKVLNIGYPYLENLKRKINLNVKKDLILFAPSWLNNKNDLLETKGQIILEELLKSNKICLRPHPQSLIKSKKTINNLIKKFQTNDNFIINTDITDLNAFNRSKALLTDNGGVCMEYYALFNRPFICIDHAEKIHNLDYKDIGVQSIEEIFKKSFGKNIDISSIPTLNIQINQYIKEFSFKKSKLSDFFDSYSIKFKDSSLIVCNEIEKILFSK